MTLAVAYSPYIRIEHPETGGEAYTTRTAYRQVWFDRGWESPLDDAAYDQIIDAGTAVALTDVIDAGSSIENTTAPIVTGGNA